MLIFAGRLQSRDPFRVGSGLAWYRVGIPPDEAHPIRVALVLDTLSAGGGDVIYPGSAIDLRGDGVWIDAPSEGGLPFIWVEQRQNPSYLHVDPLGQYRSVSGIKVFRCDLEPRIWRNVATNISGMIGFRLRAEGGTVWVGSNLDTTLPPYEQPEGVGGAWPLADGEQLVWDGNPCIWAWSDVPGARLRLLKLVRGRNW